MKSDDLSDKIIAIVALLVLVAYLGVLVYFVPQPALTVVCVLTVLLAAFDFVRMTFFGKS
jgi:hypothetical protein